MEWSEILKSRTVWTNVIGVASAFLVKYGVDISPEQQVDIITAIVAIVGVLSVGFKAKPKV